MQSKSLKSVCNLLCTRYAKFGYLNLNKALAVISFTDIKIRQFCPKDVRTNESHNALNAQISCNGDALRICDDKNECHEVIDNNDALSARVSVSKSIAPRVYLVSNNWLRIASPRQSVGEARKLIDLKKIEEIVESIAKGLPEGTDHIRGEIRDNVRIVLESTFARMNLVTREEFDAQTLVLRRTREKLEELERTVAKMEESEIQT